MTAIILAAGTGKRSQQQLNKVLVDYQGEPLFLKTVKLFLKKGFQVIVVINKNDEKTIKEYYQGSYVYGGVKRSDSVLAGLKLVTSKYVLIHDAARPFLKEAVIDELLKEVAFYDALMVAKRVYDTVYDNNLNLLKREELILAETPQVFKTTKLKEAFLNSNCDYPDEVSLYKSCYDEEVKVIFHDTNNKKITTKEDLKMLTSQFKIGHAYDIHQTKAGDEIIIGGVKIKAPFKILAHSDGDVLLHAIAEALLGALGLGDLGSHFPDSDKRFKDLASQEIIFYVNEKLKEFDYYVVNIDASVYLEEPRLSPYLNSIKENVSKLLKIDNACVNIKAGTNEGVGAIGKKEAIASEAVCLIKRRIE